MSRVPNPIYGTTIYIGEFPVDTIYGHFRGITFQDLISKGYVIALVYGSLNTDELYTRIHSSCVTSETLGSMDCDCVQQLEGALKKIQEKGNGIFFYLIQEGRGCGYVGKSRNMMLVQYEEDTTGLNTFGAYKRLGMKTDYRDYHNVKEICHILNLEDKSFVLMTNNPDKIQGFTDLNLKLARIEGIEIESNLFNYHYLRSKREFGGHLLFEIKEKKKKPYTIPFPKIVPFDPYVLETARRFIHVATYFLPVRPINNEILFSQDNFRNFKQIVQADDLSKMHVESLSTGESLVKINEISLIDKYNLAIPYWFKVHVYYDIASFQDFVVLTYGDMNYEENKWTTVPLIYIRSESLSNRFPLKTQKYKDRYNAAMKSIIKRGSGVILLYHNDGRGAGFGHFVLNSMKAKTKTGIVEDSRDYNAICEILKSHVGGHTIDITCGRTCWKNIQESLKKYQIDVKEYSYIGEGKIDVKENIKNMIMGFSEIEERVKRIPEDLEKAKNFLPKWKEYFQALSKEEIKVYTTGIGSSETHAIYLNYLNPRIKFCSYEEMVKEEKDVDRVIVFSQGLTPNIEGLLQKYPCTKLTFITSITEHSEREDRRSRYFEFHKKGGNFLHYQEETPDNTLIRITGPLVVFYLLYCSLKSETPQIKYLKPLKMEEGQKNKFRSCVLVLPNKIIPLAANIRSKFIEGIFCNELVVTDCISFVHGNFQYAVNNNSKVIFWGTKTEEIVSLVEKSGLSHEFIEISGDIDATVMELEIYFNELIFNLIINWGCNQMQWPGKEVQNIAYNKTS